VEAEDVEAELVADVREAVDGVAEPELDSCKSKSSKSIKQVKQ
jgi:hypothetical protein